MKKTTTFLGLSVALLAGVFSHESSAQQHYGVAPKFSTVGGQAANPTNYHKDYLKRFVINQPASVAGAKVYTVSNNGRGGTTQWGRAIDSAWVNVTLVKATPVGACGALSNAGAINGNWAFIRRGDCEFGAKAQRAQQAGARGVIIANNVSGGPVGMGAGAAGANINIPVLMISKDDGDAIEAELDNSVTVTLSLSAWSLGGTHDLGILPSGGALWHSYAIPSFMLGTGNGNPGVYQSLTGAFIGNFGTQTESNVKIRGTVSFTPEGGSATVLGRDSIEIPSFTVTDSIMYGYTDARVNVHATGRGRIDATYSVTADEGDDFDMDNEVTFSSYVTDSIYSRARYDFAAGKPVSTSGYGLSSGEPFIWGSKFYMTQAGKAIWHAQFVTSNGSTSNPSLEGQADMNLYVFEWTDSDTDHVMSSEELTIVGIGTKKFGAADSNSQVFTAYFNDADAGRFPVITKANTHYWVAADVPGGWFLGVDGYLNYYPRYILGAAQANPVIDAFGPMFNGSVSSLVQPGSRVQMMPFEPYYSGDSSRFSQQANGLVPSIALHLSKDDKTSVREVLPEFYHEMSVFPNPATDQLNLKISLMEKTEKLTLTVLDGMGRHVLRVEKQGVTQETIQIPTSSLASGNYFLVINTDNRAVARKFVVDRK